MLGWTLFKYKNNLSDERLPDIPFFEEAARERCRKILDYCGLEDMEE
jgi:hypothetical protein